MTMKTLTPEHLLNWHCVSTEAWNWCLLRALAYGANQLPSNTTSASDKQIALIFFNDSLDFSVGVKSMANVLHKGTRMIPHPKKTRLMKMKLPW